MTADGTSDLERARAFARELGEALPQIEELYLVGSRARGTARPDSDFDVLAVVTGRCRPGFRSPGRSPGRGYPSTLDGRPIDWCLLRAADFEPGEVERVGGGLLLWSRR